MAKVAYVAQFTNEPKSLAKGTKYSVTVNSVTVTNLEYKLGNKGTPLEGKPIVYITQGQYDAVNKDDKNHFTISVDTGQYGITRFVKAESESGKVKIVDQKVNTSPQTTVKAPTPPIPPPPKSGDVSSGGSTGGSGGTGGSSGTSGTSGVSAERSGGEEKKTDKPTEAAPDTQISKDKLNSQAEALQAAYDAAKSISPPAGAGPDLLLSIDTMIKVRNNEFQDTLAPGPAWTLAHSRVLRSAAKKLLEDVSNPELQQFVQSYDAAMAGGDVLEGTDSLGITSRGISALSSFVGANMDTQPQRGLAQLILRAANVNDGALSPRGPTLLASAWSLIFALHSEFARLKTLSAIGGSPVMRYPVPSREESDRNDEPAASANVKANLTLKVWSQADRDGFFGVGPDSIVIVFKPADESFAKTVAQLPVGTGFTSLFKTARGTREEIVGSSAKKGSVR